MTRVRPLQSFRGTAVLDGDLLTLRNLRASHLHTAALKLLKKSFEKNTQAGRTRSPQRLSITVEEIPGQE